MYVCMYVLATAKMRTKRDSTVLFVIFILIEWILDLSLSYLSYVLLLIVHFVNFQLDFQK